MSNVIATAGTAATAPTGTDPQSLAQSLTGTAGTPSKTDFLKLLVTQLSHQDPTAPQTDTEFVAQLAQFASLEQAQNQTQILTQLQQQLGAQSGTQATGLLGHTITASFSSIGVSQNQPDPLQFTLDSGATSVTLVLTDAQGNVVRNLQTGPLSAGPQSILWDGKSNGGVALPTGNYNVQISANGPKGPVGAHAEIKGKVTGVAYVQGQPVLQVGAAQVQLSNVSLVSP